MEQVSYVEATDIDNAASSWSGFMYQGKVAIYVCLKIINKNLSNTELLKDYTLRIEDLEDFVILKSNNIKSIHQVKAKPTTNTIGSYNEANLNLLGKLAKYSTIEKAYLHTATKIKPFCLQDFKTNISGYNVEGKKKVLKEYKENIFQTDGFFETLSEKLCFTFTDETLNSENEYDCAITIDQIKEKILHEIDYFFENCGVQEIKDSSKNCENTDFLYCELINMVHDGIHKYHLKEQNLIEMNLYELYILLTNKNIFTFSKETFVKFILLQLTQDCIEYCHEQGLEDNEIRDFLSLWQGHIEALGDFNWEQIFYICLKLTPDYSYLADEEITLESIRKILPSDGVRNSFLYGLNSFGEYINTPKDLKEAYTFCDQKKINLLTTISRKGKNAHNTVGQKIIENCKNNSQMLEILFEVDCYINTFLNNTYDGNITEVSSDVSSTIIVNSDATETITSMKKISFVTVEKLLEEI